MAKINRAQEATEKALRGEMGRAGVVCAGLPWVGGQELVASCQASGTHQTEVWNQELGRRRAREPCPEGRTRRGGGGAHTQEHRGKGSRMWDEDRGKEMGQCRPSEPFLLSHKGLLSALLQPLWNPRT